MVESVNIIYRIELSNFQVYQNKLHYNEVFYKFTSLIEFKNMKLVSKLHFTLITILTIMFVNNVMGQDFEVAPVKLEFDTEPGENLSKTVTVKNHSNKKVSFIVSIGDFLPTSIGERKYMAPNSTKRSCANWLNINPSFFELSPADEIKIQVGMLVPNDQYSSAWCMVYIQPTREQSSWNSDKNLGAGVTVSGRIGVLIYQSPKSNTNNSLKISNLTEISKPGEKDRTFSATIENLGDKITKSSAYLVASNMKTAEEQQFQSIDFETFPKMSRTIELKMPVGLAPGVYSLAAIVDYGSKYALEGTQIIIEVKSSEISKSLDTTLTKSDTLKIK